MPQNEGFHCCVAFIGFCCLTSSCVSLTMAALYMSGMKPTYKEQGSEREHNEKEAHLIGSALVELVGITCDVGLLVAVAKQIPQLILAWVVAAPLRGLCNVIFAIIVCAKYHTRSPMVYVDAAFTGIFLLFLMFFASVCFNYYRLVLTKNQLRARLRVARGDPSSPATRNAQMASNRTPRRSEVRNLGGEQSLHGRETTQYRTRPTELSRPPLGLRPQPGHHIIPLHEQ